MSRLVMNGAETRVPLTSTAANDGEGDSWVQTGAVTVTTTNPRSGAAAWSCAPSAVNTVSIGASAVGLVTDRTYFLRTAFRFNATPTNTLCLIEFRSSAGVAARLSLKTDKTLSIQDSTLALVGNVSGVLSVDTWYVIELKVRVPSAGNGTTAFRLDGVDVQTDLSTNTGNTVGQLRFGHGVSNDTAATVVVDDIAVNDDQGANQNSWPDVGRIVLLKPVSDSAVGTGWLEADGTTGSLYDNVDNTPPTGVAATPTTGATQIKNASATAGNLAYDAAVTDYTTAGVASGDVIDLVRGLYRLSGSSTTGTNNALARIVSNPADGADTTFTAAFDVVAGAEPSGWVTWRLPIVYSPTVTKGTQPVLRLIKNAAASRVHMADLIVLEVEYRTPGAASDNAPQGGATAGGAVPVAQASQTIGGALAGGAVPVARASLTAGGATAGGNAPTARAAQTIGGALASGAAPTARSSTTIAGATAGGNAATASASLTAGGATAGGVGPGAPVFETPVPGGAIASGNVPTARTSVVQGGAAAAGSPANAAVALVQGGATAAGNAPAPMRSDAVPQGGAAASGTPPSRADVTLTAGGAIAGGVAPSEQGETPSPIPGGAIAGGNSPTALASVTAGGALAQGWASPADVPVGVGGATAGGIEPTERTFVEETPAPGGATAGGVSPPLALVALELGGATAGGNPIPFYVVRWGRDGDEHWAGDTEGRWPADDGAPWAPDEDLVWSADSEPSRW